MNILHYADFIFELSLIKYSCNRVNTVTFFEMKSLNAGSMTSYYGEAAVRPT